MDSLFANRDVTADWHVAQARRLLDLALTDGSATALIYAALEARNALERLPFEMSVLATGGRFTSEQLRMAQRKDGGFKLLGQALNDHRRYIEFQNICMEVDRIPFRFPVPDIRRCRRLRTDLNPYCHCQLDPQDTIRDLAGKWFVTGAAIVAETCDFLDPLLSGPRGGLPRDTMPIEAGEIFDAYLAGEIDAPAVRTRLDLIQPVLAERLRKQGH